MTAIPMQQVKYRTSRCIFSQSKDSWYWDSPKNPAYRYETFVSSELVKYIDRNYKTIADRKGRAITGLSMGGHGAMWLGIRHKDVFGAAGSTSGCVDIRPFPKNWSMNKQLGELASNKIMIYLAAQQPIVKVFVHIQKKIILTAIYN